MLAPLSWQVVANRLVVELRLRFLHGARQSNSTNNAANSSLNRVCTGSLLLKSTASTLFWRLLYWIIFRITSGFVHLTNRAITATFDRFADADANDPVGLGPVYYCKTIDEQTVLGLAAFFCSDNRKVIDEGGNSIVEHPEIAGSVSRSFLNSIIDISIRAF